MSRLGKYLMVACALSGCATAYQAKGFAGGYSETQLAENIFEVRFRGNGYTSSERAADFALLRCAELTLAAGFSHFVLIDRATEIAQSQYRTPTYTTGSAVATTSGTHTTATGTATSYGGQTVNIRKPRATNMIACYNGAPEGQAAFNAEFVASSIRRKYRLSP